MYLTAQNSHKSVRKRSRNKEDRSKRGQGKKQVKFKSKERQKAFWITINSIGDHIQPRKKLNQPENTYQRSRIKSNCTSWFMVNLNNFNVLFYLMLSRQPHSLEDFGKALFGQWRNHLSEASLGIVHSVDQLLDAILRTNFPIDAKSIETHWEL